VPVGLPADLLRRRPDVRHAERELAAATADVGAAIAAQFPRLSLVGAAGLDSIRSGDLTSAASRYWTIAPQLTLPLVAGGRLRSGVRAAQANLDAAVATYRGTVLRAVADAESSIVRYGAALTRLSAFGAAADARESNLAAIRQRQEAGDASMVDLLAAERAADDATEQRTLAAVEVAARYIALNKALGGGWQQP
jgi:outer membrane protein TolC